MMELERRRRAAALSSDISPAGTAVRGRRREGILRDVLGDPGVVGSA